jgi:branched-chain amino acid transport system substrate-binding protein
MGTDATGQQLDRDFDAAKARPENASITFVAHEHFNISDVSLAAQIAKIKAMRPQALLTWTVGPAFGTLLHAASDGGLDVPILGSGGDMIYAQLEQYQPFLPKELLFVSTLPFTKDSTGKGPVRDAQEQYFAAFQSLGVKPDFPQQLAWDPAWIVIDAYRHLGVDATADQFRSYIAGLHSWSGINGIYDFRDGSQRGIGENSGMMFRWDGTTREFIAVSKRAGYAKTRT